MKARLSHLLVCALLGSLALSCRRAGPPPPAPTQAMGSRAVAVVAGEEISAEAFRAELQRCFRNAPEGGLTTGKKLEALERLVRQEAIYAQAKASGFEQSPEMQARIKQLVIALFREQRFTNATPAVSEPEIEAAYQASGERYAQPSSARGAVIFISATATATPEKKAEIRARAGAIWSEARMADEPAFARLAARHSEDQAGRYRAGDTGWISRNDSGIETALVEALFALEKPGDIAPLVSTARGFYVAKLTGKRDSGRRPFAEVKEVIRYQLTRDKAAQAERDFAAAMKAGLGIEINHQQVEAISPSAPNSAPPRFPGATTAQAR